MLLIYLIIKIIFGKRRRVCGDILDIVRNNSPKPAYIFGNRKIKDASSTASGESLDRKKKQREEPCVIVKRVITLNARRRASSVIIFGSESQD